MTKQRLEITPEDMVEGEILDYEVKPKEFWNTYKLSDGTVLKVKLVVVDVKRLKKHRPDGVPVYHVNTLTVIRIVTLPEKLRKKPRTSSSTPSPIV